MKKETKNFNKNAKMHLACAKDELRPTFALIHFIKGFAYASESHILVKNPISEISNFNEQEISALDGKSIHMNLYKEMLKYDDVLISEDGFECTKGDEKAFFYFNEIDKVPSFDTVINNAIQSKNSSITDININVELLKDMTNAMGITGGVTMIFKEESKSIIVKPLDEMRNSIGIIMPIIG